MLYYIPQPFFGFGSRCSLHCQRAYTLVEAWLPYEGTIPVVACGMVGARQGWAEAPYAATPCQAPGPVGVLR